MKKTLIATLMAMVFGLFSMPALQAAPNNGWTVGPAVNNADSLVQNVRRRRRRRRSRRRRRRRRRYCYPVHRRRSRVRERCRWRWGWYW